MIVSGRGGQVDVSLRDVMLSQLNYKASAYLNDGVHPRRHPFGAHSFYVPAQLFPTADGYLALFITHDGFWKSFAAEAGIDGFPTMAERSARRDEVLAVVTGRWPTDTAGGVGGQAAAAGHSRGGGAVAPGGARRHPGGRGLRGGVPPGRQSGESGRVPARLPAAAGARRVRRHAQS